MAGYADDLEALADDSFTVDDEHAGITLADLMGERRWVAWRLEPPRPGAEPTKVPYRADGRTKAKNNDPRTWCTRAEARAALPRLLTGGNIGGIGIGLGASPLPSGALLAGIDIDTCRKPSGPIERWAATVLRLVRSYAEISPSDTGLKIFMLIDPDDMPALLRAIGKTDEGGQRYKRSWTRGRGKHPPAIELHLDHSYFTVTGRHHPGTPTEMRVIPKAALLRLIREIGPDFKAGYPRAEASKGRSEKGMGVAHRVKANGGSQEDFEEALDDDPDTASWKADHDHRQLDRAWRRAAAGDALTDLEGFGLNEDGVAMMFAARHRHRLRFSHHDKCWYEWNGCYWRRDETRRGFNFAREICRDIRLKAAADSAARALAKAITASAVERFAQADPALTATAETWDHDLWLLGTPSDTIDLRTGELRPARQDDFITKITAVTPSRSFDPVFSCPLWLRFLREATGGDAEFIRYLQQWCGYCLTGDTTEQSLTFIYGPGGNGKTVFLSTLSGILGDYARTAGMETFTASHGERHLTELARLHGARLVVASETEQGKGWAENRIKQLTGGDTVTANFMRQDHFEFRPQFKLTIIGNNKPTLRNVGPAIERRLNLAPFEQTPERKDLELEAKLKTEWPDILAWMIAGCLDWQKNRLIRPKIVQAATAEYLADQDIFGQWLSENCAVRQDFVATVSELWLSWCEFAREQGTHPGTRSGSFADNMRSKGFEGFRDKYGKRGRGFKGLRLREYDF